jgi:hypothetical protein
MTENLYQKFPPSESCTCEKCVSFCKRPGWWTVDEAARAIFSGYARRMMLELSPERTFGVLSPAFKGNEVNFALQVNSINGCTFLYDNRCELFGTGLMPIECRFCHHDRVGQGVECHTAIENEWKGNEAKRLIVRWGNITGFWEKQGLVMVEKS